MLDLMLFWDRHSVSNLLYDQSQPLLACLTDTKSATAAQSREAAALLVFFITDENAEYKGERIPRFARNDNLALAYAPTHLILSLRGG